MLNIYHNFELSVRYNETDKMGIAYHANYLIWFNSARDHFFSKQGIDIKKQEGKGYFMPVVYTECHHLSPVFFQDMIVIKTTLSSIVATKFTFEYIMTKKNRSTTVAKGKTISVLTDTDRKVLLKVPEYFSLNLRGKVE